MKMILLSGFCICEAIAYATGLVLAKTDLITPKWGQKWSVHCSSSPKKWIKAGVTSLGVHSEVTRSTCLMNGVKEFLRSAMTNLSRTLTPTIRKLTYTQDASCKLFLTYRHVIQTIVAPIKHKIHIYCSTFLWTEMKTEMRRGMELGWQYTFIQSRHFCRTQSSSYFYINYTIPSVWGMYFY